MEKLRFHHFFVSKFLKVAICSLFNGFEISIKFLFFYFSNELWQIGLFPQLRKLEANYAQKDQKRESRLFIKVY